MPSHPNRRLNDRLTLTRGGVLLEPREGVEYEAWGVLNPASARGTDGRLRLFPRLVGPDNYSRIGVGVVHEDGDGVPSGYEPLGLALEPEHSWERNARTAGTEDARITRIDALGCWIMTYAAHGPLGPRIALARSSDLETWERLGPVTYSYEARHGIDWNLPCNKDALFFPEPVNDPAGRPAIAVLHRPMFDLSEITPGESAPLPAGLTHDRLGMWISYIPLEDALADPRSLTHWSDHELVALPEHEWEWLKIGGGTPPVLTDEGWLIIHHGVQGELLPNTDHQPHVIYCAGAMLLDRDDPRIVFERSDTALLAPETAEEREGIVPNVVFPTAIEPHGDGWIGFYGMADTRIGWFRLALAPLPSSSDLR